MNIIQRRVHSMQLKKNSNYSISESLRLNWNLRHNFDQKRN